MFLQVRASGQNRAHTGSIVLQAGVWHHIVMTYDGSQNINGVRLYVDGVVDTTPASGTITNTLLHNQDAYFGRRSSSFHYSGNFDEISIWNKDLSSGEVDTIYNSGSPQNVADLTFSTNLVSFYRCGDGDADPTIFDNHGVNDLNMVNMENSDFVSDTP